MTSMFLHVHVPDAEPYPIGDEIWDGSLAEAIAAEAEIVADDADADLLPSPLDADRDQLRDRVINEMTARLVSPGDSYQAPDGIRYSLNEAPS